MTSTKITNQKIAKLFDEIALYLRAENVQFKPQAYEIAAENIISLEEELSDSYKKCGKKCIDEIPGIGKSMVEKIEELVQTGRLKYYDDLKKKYPFDMLALTSIQDIGPKTALTLFKKLKIKTIDDLLSAAEKGSIAKIPSMGVKTQRNVLRGIQFLKASSGRRIIHQVLPLAQNIVKKLQNISGVTHIDIAGSLRRKKETIGDIDLLATTTNPKQLIKTFTSLPEVEQVLEVGPKKAMVRYTFGMQGDILILKPSEYGAALIHFTGSKEHNILLREFAIKKKMKLSEHGLVHGKKIIAAKTEKQVYTALGLQEIPPEIRVGADEIKLAQKHKIPELIPYDSLKGDLQVQTDWSDGDSSIEEMALAAKNYRLSYIAITDHTQSLTITNGLNEKRLLEQGKEIDKLNKKLKNFRVLKSTECDIKKDGSLDLSDRALKTLDVVSVSVHSNRKMEKNAMTERIIKAMKHPFVHIFFHPSGRIVNIRDGYEIEMDKIIKAAKEYHVALEVNGSERLDLHEKYIRQAVELGVKLVINSDCHTQTHFTNLDFGIGQARRGWATKADVLNTKTVDAFLKAIKK
ncbi:DNA polymerase/3'-5' exonuclease PolX [Candidatus Uhrbacteria bacterium]|nr:DNA polymerase/3'-5' exonuclease PolX [Candidatus Uhrbacteria bacterium]